MPLDRRTFLRAAGVSLALPLLEASRSTARAAAAEAPRRMVCICAPLGLHAPNLFPEQAGKDYASTPYLDVLKELRSDFTVMSGLAHPDMGATHDSIFSFLTAAPHPEVRGGFRNSISLDQFAAEKIGGQTRFPSLALSAEGFSLSWTQSGALVPSEQFPSALFAKMFLEGKPEDVQAQVRRLKDGRSILDAIGLQARGLEGQLGARDREKMDEYFTSVRDLEKRLATAEAWSARPKPKVDAKPPANVANPADVMGKSRLMLDLVHLAFASDSTRLITLLLPGTSLVPLVTGVTQGHHDLSHHGQDPTKIQQLKLVELEMMKALGELLTKLKGSQEEGQTLLDRTMVFFSSNLGNAATHGVKNLPVIFAGGGFKHGQHLAFDQKSPPPLSNLFVSMLQRLGIEADKFGSSTGPLAGLEAA